MRPREVRLNLVAPVRVGDSVFHKSLKDATSSRTLIYHDQDPVPQVGDEGLKAHPPGRWLRIPNRSKCAIHDLHCRWKLHLPNSYRKDLLAALRASDHKALPTVEALCGKHVPDPLLWDGARGDGFVDCNHHLISNNLQNRVLHWAQAAITEGVMWIGAIKLGLFLDFLKLQLFLQPMRTASIILALLSVFYISWRLAAWVFSVCGGALKPRKGKIS